MVKKGKNSTANAREAIEAAVTDTPAWLRRFLFSLSAVYCCLFLLFAGYDIWAAIAVTGPAEQALSSSPPDVKRAFLLLEHPHFFAGYQPWHDFGPAGAAREAQRVDAMVAAGSPYGHEQIVELRRGASFWLASFRKHKLEGSVPVMPGDAQVAQSLLDRWTNARTVTHSFMLYLALVALITGALYLIYRKYRLWNRIR